MIDGVTDTIDVMAVGITDDLIMPDIVLAVLIVVDMDSKK